METLHLNGHTNPGGHLTLNVPTSLQDADVDVTVTVRPAVHLRRDTLGWPIGFWEKFTGSMPDLPDVPDHPAEADVPLE